MKRILAVLTAAMLLLVPFCGCGNTDTAASSKATSSRAVSSKKTVSVAIPTTEHIHTPGNPATCTDDLVCTECGEVLEKAHGHTPGTPATETSPQVCIVCGAVLQKATGAPASVVTLPEETVNTGHYLSAASYSNAKGNVMCCGNYLMEYYSLSRSGNASYAAAISAFAAKYPQLRVFSMLLPKCASFQSPSDRTDQFDNHKAHIDATYAMMTGVTGIDAFGEMAQHRGEYLFFRTDHHWTSLGAYYASVAAAKALGFTPRPLDSYEAVVSTASFWGSLYSTFWGSNPPSTVNADLLIAHVPSSAYAMCYSKDAAATTATIAGTAVNTTASSYAAMFLCGDKPFTYLVTENKNGRKLLVFKESYGNAFVPYMIDYFEEIVVVDMRYSTASVAAIIAQYGITDVICEHNSQAMNGQLSQLKARLES